MSKVKIKSIFAGEMIIRLNFSLGMVGHYLPTPLTRKYN